MSSVIWFNVWDGHFKMWGFDVYQDNATGACELIIYYGKIATSLSKLIQRRKNFPRYGECYDYIMEKIKDKHASGYVKLQNNIYSRYTCGDLNLSDLVAAIEAAKEREYANGKREPELSILLPAFFDPVEASTNKGETHIVEGMKGAST